MGTFYPKHVHFFDSNASRIFRVHVPSIHFVFACTLYSSNTGNRSSSENCTGSASLDIDTISWTNAWNVQKNGQVKIHVSISPAWILTRLPLLRDICFTLRMLRALQTPKRRQPNLCWILCVKRAGAGLLGSRGEGERQCGAANS